MKNKNKASLAVENKNNALKIKALSVEQMENNGVKANYNVQFYTVEKLTYEAEFKFVYSYFGHLNIYILNGLYVMTRCFCHSIT